MAHSITAPAALARFSEARSPIYPRYATAAAASVIAIALTTIAEPAYLRAAIVVFFFPAVTIAAYATKLHFQLILAERDLDRLHGGIVEEQVY